MDGHRRYAEEPEPSWYTSRRASEDAAQGPAANPYESGVHERPSGAFRLPEQRPSGYSSPDPVTTSGSYSTSSTDSGSLRIPVRGPEYPTIRPTGADAATYGATAAPEPVASYSARRPVSSLVFAVVTAVLLVPAVLLLVQVAFIDDPVARGVVPAVLLVLGLPLTGMGLYSLAAGGRAPGRDAWLRPPLAYLPVGLILLLAAGLGVA
ncbi:hypothetical protein AB0J80_14340 [Actinoplanes sp. NPDC049548]|uniref:hypothetical protein n=1 Tax=Actinoplanes sp. NPDC049548 TaxID=3155152 RepID=UPI0034126135